MIGAGAYYLSGWVGMPLAMGFGKLTQGLVYAGTFNGYVVLPLVSNLPWAIVAAATGAVVVLLVESDHPIRWVFLPAILYGFLGFFGYHWARQPLPLDRVAQAIRRVFSRVRMYRRCAGGKSTKSKLSFLNDSTPV